jgi:hypothetical protein
MLYLFATLGGPNNQSGGSTSQQLRDAFSRYIDEAEISLVVLASLFYAMWHLRNDERRMDEE